MQTAHVKDTELNLYKTYVSRSSQEAGDSAMKRIKFLTASRAFKGQELQRRTEQLNSLLSKGYLLETEIVEEGPAFLEGAGDFQTAVAALVNRISRISKDECDVILISGGIDPGLAEARRVAKVPVVAPGEVALFLASTLGKRLSIITVTEAVVAKTREMVGGAKVKPETVSIRCMDFPVRRIISDLEGARKALTEQCYKAVKEDHADVLYLGSMSLGTLGVVEKLRSELNVPIIDPMLVGIKIAELICSLA